MSAVVGQLPSAIIVAMTIIGDINMLKVEVHIDTLYKLTSNRLRQQLLCSRVIQMNRK